MRHLIFIGSKLPPHPTAAVAKMNDFCPVLLPSRPVLCNSLHSNSVVPKWLHFLACWGLLGLSPNTMSHLRPVPALQLVQVCIDPWKKIRPRKGVRIQWMFLLQNLPPYEAWFTLLPTLTPCSALYHPIPAPPSRALSEHTGLFSNDAHSLALLCLWQP